MRRNLRVSLLLMGLIPVIIMGSVVAVLSLLCGAIFTACLVTPVTRIFDPFFTTKPKGKDQPDSL